MAFLVYRSLSGVAPQLLFIWPLIVSRFSKEAVVSCVLPMIFYMFFIADVINILILIAVYLFMSMHLFYGSMAVARLFLITIRE